MPKKSNLAATEVQKWLAKIQFAEKVRDDADKLYGYSRALDEYKGLYGSSMPSFLRDTQLIPINEIFAYAKTFVASVYSRDPHLSFNAKGAQSIGSAKILELATNAYWRELRIKNQVRRAIFDAIFAEGYIKLGFNGAKTFGKIRNSEDEAGIEQNEFIENNEIFAVRVSWKHIVRDPDAVDGLHDARWVAQKIVKPFSVIENSDLYTAKDIKPTHSNDVQLKLNGRIFPGGEKEEFIEFWEVWDADTNKVYWVTEGCDEYMREPIKWPYRFNGYPFELLRFNDCPDEPYAPNLICAWEPQLWEKIKIRSMQMDHIKRFNRQLWAKKNTVTRAEMQKFALGKTGAINEYEGDVPPIPAQYPQIQTDIYAIENRVDVDKDNISGQPNAVRSAPQKTQTRTLGEINTMVTSFESRQNEPQGLVEDFCGEIAYKLAALMKDFLPGEKFVQCTLEDQQTIIQALGPEKWDGNGFRFTRQDIAKAEFEAEVKAGSTLPLDRKGRIETMINMLKLGPSIGIQPNGKVSLTIGKNMMTEFEIKEIELAYISMLKDIENQQKMAQAQAEMDNAMLQKKIADVRGQHAAIMTKGNGAPATKLSVAQTTLDAARHGGVPGGGVFEAGL